jgi:PAS domain S-box-containing protein
MNESSYFVAEAARLAALASYELLDSEPDPALDALTRTAAAVCGTPMSLITLCGVDRHWFKSNVGVPGVAEVPLNIAFCSHTVRGAGPFEVVDAAADPRFADHPLVTQEPKIRAYYGLPLRSREGYVLGALCVVDRVPRALDARQRAALEDLAQVATALFEHRRTTLQAQRAADALDCAATEVLVFEGETQTLRYANALGRQRLGTGAPTIASALPGFAPEAIERAVRDVLAGAHRECVREGMLRLPDGRQRLARARIERLQEAPPLLLVQIENADARQRLEARLQEHEDRLHALVNEAPALVWLADPDGNLTFVNGRWTALTGREPRELLGRGWLQYVADPAREAATQAYAAAVARREPFRMELPIIARPGGELRLLLDGVPRIDGNNRLHGFIGVAVDVSRRTEHDGARAAKAVQWRDAFGAAGEEIWERSPGWPELESEVHPEDRARVRAALEEHLAGATPRFACEFRVVASDGGVRWVVDRGQFVAGTPEGIAGRLVGVRQDVTLGHQREEELRVLSKSLAERTAELHAVVEEFPTFLLAAAHDLRAPLRAVSGYAEVLKQDLPPMAPPRAVKAVSRIIRSAADLDTLLEALLRLSSLSQLPLRIQPTALDGVVRDAWQELQSEGKGRDVELVVHHLPTVACDPGLLTRAFVNLLSNAVKFSAAQPAPRVEIGTESLQDGQVTVFVRDNGVGFDPEYATQLFEPFRRFHKRSEFPGHGMGLAIVHRIVQRHNGRVWARSDAGRGATFYMVLPLAEMAPRERKDQRIADPSSNGARPAAAQMAAGQGCGARPARAQEPARAKPAAEPTRATVAGAVLGSALLGPLRMSGL